MSAAVEPIAVIGVSCRFPQSPDLASYWNLLANGVDAITEVPANRWDPAAFHSATPRTPGKMITRSGGFLQDPYGFDPIFFKIMPVEAARIDPQHRLVLETAWEALESAAIDPTKLSFSKTGVFVGLSHSDHDRLLYQDRTLINGYNGPDTYHCFAANRVSYFLNVRGPSMSFDSACSSSLAAIHTACRSLRDGESNLALAGGVNLNLTPDEFIALSFLGVLSPDGRSRAFDASAAGYGRSEGCGVIVLKRLRDAVADGDTVWAVIRGSAVNHNGLSNGITAPNGAAQEEVMRDALANAGLAPEDVSLIEAQGTGTPMGDVIEAGALKKVYPHRCYLGTVKTNIGHAEAASGIAGVIKVLLAMRHGCIPAHLHLKQLNPQISGGLPYDIPLERTAWNGRRIAAVSAFGFGGANAHVLLEHLPAAYQTPPDDFPRVLVLSAKSMPALQQLCARYADHLRTTPVEIANVCYTAALGRAHFDHRVAVEFTSREHLMDQLQQFPPSLYGKAARNAAPVENESLAEAFRRGAPIDWRRQFPEPNFQKLQLPSYPFQRQQCRFG